MSAFGERNKASGRQVCDRATQQANLGLYLTIFYEWKREAMLNANTRMNQHKVTAKREQLLGVQKMFREFANQLEAQLKGSDAGDNTARGMKYARTKKDPGSCSLPDIHSNRSGKA